MTIYGIVDEKIMVHPQQEYYAAIKNGDLYEVIWNNFKDIPLSE